jgi:hypothetical protein
VVDAVGGDVDVVADVPVGREGRGVGGVWRLGGHPERVDGVLRERAVEANEVNDDIPRAVLLEEVAKVFPLRHPIATEVDEAAGGEVAVEGGGDGAVVAVEHKDLCVLCRVRRVAAE